MKHETTYGGYTFRIQTAGDRYFVNIYKAGERVPVQNLVTKSLESAYEFYERKLVGLIEASRPCGVK